MNLLRRYLLATADSAFWSGFWLVSSSALLLGGSFGFGRMYAVGMWVICAGFVMGVAVGAVQHHYSKIHIARKCDFYKEDLSYRRGLEYSTLIKVQRGKVVGVGGRFWGKDGVHLVIVPWIICERCFLPLTLSKLVGTVLVSVKASLEVFVSSEEDSGDQKNLRVQGFSAQELYDKVIEAGHENVGAWLVASFTKAAGNSEVIQVFETFGKAEQPYAFLNAMNLALKQVPFKCELSNISEVRVKVEAEAPLFATSVTYS